MALSLYAQALQHCQPYVAQGSIFGQREVLAQFQIRTTAGEQCWTIVEIMNRADIRSKGLCGVIE